MHVYRSGLIATHTSDFLLVFPKDKLEFMLKLTDIFVNTDAFAFEAKVDATGRTGFWTIFASFTHTTFLFCLFLSKID